MNSTFCHECDKSLVLENGQIYYDENEAFYRCNDGYQIEGAAIRYCGRRSVWSLPEPICKLKNFLI